MKVNIGPYLKWWGPYQIAALLEYVGIKEETYCKVGNWLGDSKAINNICQYIYAKRKRKIEVKIDNYDTWNMDTTLAIIVLPMLRQLKATKHGAPTVDSEDVPERLRSTTTDENGIDEKWFERWDWILDEIIWAFEQKQPDNDWEAAYHHGIIDWNLEGDAMTYGSKHTHSFDVVGHTRHQGRISNGLRLFGKYYENLWD